MSLKLETKIMNFMWVFFEKKYNQVNSSIVNITILVVPVSRPASSYYPNFPFAEFGFVFIDFIAYFRFKCHSY